jgi:hypothetical protein
MSDYGYPASNWQNDAQQQIADGQWEEVLTAWVRQTEPCALSLWLLGCLRAIGLPASCTKLLEEMQRWYEKPDEKLRWQIFYHAEILGFDTPAGALALSLFWSQGSMSPEGLEPVYPEPHLSAEMRRCVLLMLATHNADTPAEGTRRLLAQWIHQEKA